MQNTEIASERKRILIDIDGPTISFAIADPQDPLHLGQIQQYQTSAFPTATDSVMQFARDAGIKLADCDCALVVSGAVTGDAVRIARCPWIISISGFRYLFQTTPLVLNDTAAMAWAATKCSPMTHRPLGAYNFPDYSKSGKWLAINCAGGLGAAVVLSKPGGGLMHFESEAGHTGFAPCDDQEQILARNLAKVKRPVSWEHALLADPANGSWVGTEVEQNRQLLATRRAGILGSFTGDVVLATGTWDGVFLFKVAASAVSSTDCASLFLKRMEARANYGLQLRKVPVWAVTIANVNLAGAAIYFDNLVATGRSSQNP